MKIQSLAIMFIILILPISLVMASYTETRVQTLSIQSKYDSKLNEATYDALKAYQINSFNNVEGALADSKMRDIQAAVNTFFNSMSTSFSSLGYSKESIQNYVPALVFTMYDGYYIYSPFVNHWDSETKKRTETERNADSYQDEETLFGLKPYIYYSCRYKYGSDTDVVITYSLDNYIQIKGKVNGNYCSKYGYLMNYNDIKFSNNGNTVVYNGGNNNYITINNEDTSILKENIFVDGDVKSFSYIKRQGIKYYYDESKGKVFTVSQDGKSNIQEDFTQELKDKNLISGNKLYNSNAVNYYKESKELMDFIKDSDLINLTVKNIVDENGNSYNDNNNPYYQFNGKIFDLNNCESEDSNFNTHRIDVIKNSIEKNLSVAIANFNNYYGASSSINFQMPKLKDTDWDKIMDNISIISFLQGINIGGKIYNGYSIITNTKNEDVVTKDSIYIQTTNNSTFHRITEKGLNINNQEQENNTVGIFNVNTERRTGQDTNGNSIYYFPVEGKLSYDSIVTQNNISENLKDMSLDEYVKTLDPRLQQKYYTALARERYGIYRPKIEF